jgi:hypothetical protein
MNFFAFVINQTVFSTHAVITCTSTFHLPPQTRCFPCISNPLCTLHKICLLLSIPNEIRLQNLFLQAKILLTPDYHEGVLRDVKVKLRILSLYTMARCAVCFTVLLRTHGGPHTYSWLQNWRHQSQSLNDGDKGEKNWGHYRRRSVVKLAARNVITLSRSIFNWVCFRHGPHNLD